MIRNKQVQDRLYLSQGDEESIYIDNCKIPQHHIEGIRFLYRQFKRKKNGVIINDPFGFGRNIQIILFLKAIRSLLDKPVLILCQEGGENDWFDRFYTWTDMFDEVVIETTNPMIKKEVIINTMVNLHLFCAREWSVIIVDGDKVTSANPILKLPFQSDFKIWNTPINMKENLDTFGDIYKWLFPHEIFEKHYFIPDPESAVDVIEKSIFLDSFLEDIVIRRDDLNPSFEKHQSDVEMPPPKATTIPAVAPTFTATTATSTAKVDSITALAPITKKNKDATGTKIKRSKARRDAEAGNKSFDPPTAAITKLLGESSKAYAPFDSTEDFSIENYKRKHSEDIEDVKKDKAPFEIIEIGNMSSSSDVKLYYDTGSEAKTAVDKLEEMDTLVFGHDTFISKVTDMYKPGKGHTATDKKDTEPHTILTCKPVEQTTHKFVTEHQNRSISDTSRKYSGGSSSSDSERDKKNDRQSVVPNKSKGNSNDPRIQTKINLDELNKEISDMGKKDNIEKIVKRQKTTETKSAGCASQSVNYDEIKVNTNELKQTSDSGTMITEQANSLKRNNIEDKMKECEEKLSKKFKGSVLDSLF